MSTSLFCRCDKSSAQATANITHTNPHIHYRHSNLLEFHNCSSFTHVKPAQRFHTTSQTLWVKSAQMITEVRQILEELMSAQKPLKGLLNVSHLKPFQRLGVHKIEPSKRLNVSHVEPVQGLLIVYLKPSQRLRVH